MKVSVKVTGSSGSLFGGTGQTVETKIEVDEKLFDSAALMEVTNALGIVAGMIVRDIESRAAREPDEEPAEEDADGEPEDGTRVDDTGARPRGAGDVVRAMWKDGSSRLFFDTGQHLYSPEIVGVFATPMALEYADPEVTLRTIAVLGKTQGVHESPEHPALADIRDRLGDAVITADEAQTIRNLALAAERRGDEEGITNGR